MPKVLMAPATLAGLEGRHLQMLREAGFEIVWPWVKGQMNEEELLDHLVGIDATLAGSEPYTARVLAARPQLKIIARAGVGYDAVDLQACNERGVAVCFTPGTNHDCVAEHTFAMMLALAKDLINQHLGTRAGSWPRQATLPLRGRTLAIAGLGRIGKAVAVRGEAFSMKLLAYEPYPDQAFVERHHVTLVPFETLLAEADYLCIHAPFTAETRHLINKKTLALMKPTAFLLNLARGALVNEADLYDALKNKRLAGAAMDVFEQEPPPVTPLLELPNVVLTPHGAGTDTQSRDDMAACAARAIVELSRGEWPAELVVNKDVRGRFQWKV